MFNEYENFPAPPPPPSPSDSDDESDAEGPELVMTSRDISLGDIAKDLTNNISIWDAQNSIDFEAAKFEKDYHLSKISNNGGDSLVYDNEGLLTHGFEFEFSDLTLEVANNRLTGPKASNLHNGNIVIYKDLIEDKVATGGDIASGEFILYAPAGASLSRQPGVKKVSFDPTVEGAELEITEFNDARFRTAIEYNASERQGFYLKYAAISASVGQGTADEPTDAHLNNIFDAMALEVYNMVLTREYVPKMIIQKTNLMRSAVNATLGDESPPPESAVYNTTTSYEEEA